MKKIIITMSVLLILSSGGQTGFASPYTSTIGKIENSLFGFQYTEDSETSRVDRIEKSVYGTSTTKPMEQRIAKLKTDLSADLIGQEIKPVEDTFAEEENTIVEKEPVASSNVSYPAIDELEQIVFNQTFPKTDIKERLSKLEQKTFQKAYNDDLSTRTDRLKAEIKPQSLMDNQIAQSSNDFYDEDVPPLGADYHLNQYQSPNSFDYNNFNSRQQMMKKSYQNDYAPQPKKVTLSAVEKSVLKQTYANETTEHRLTRLEDTMFGTNFNSDTNETRLERVSSAYRAQKSSTKYDSNKFSQNMTTAVQIGTLLLMVLACIL